MKSIFIGGKERPVVFKMSTIAKFLRSEGIDSNKLLGIDLLGSMHLCFYGLADGARKSGIKVDFTKDDVMDWIDEDGFGDDTPFANIMEEFGESMKGIGGEQENDELSDDDKKSVEESVKN